MKFAHLVSFAWPARGAVGTFEKPGTYPHFCSVHPKMGVPLENSANITSRHSPHHRLKVCATEAADLSEFVRGVNARHEFPVSGRS